MTQFVLTALTVAARNARWVLVAGLAVALAAPSVTLIFKPLIPLFIALLLFAASFRVGPKHVFGAFTLVHRPVSLAVVLQCLVPLVLLLCIVPLGLSGVYVVAVMLVASAAPISGSPNLVLMLGGDPAPALRQLIIGTAVLPITAIPLFWWLPGIGDTTGIFVAAGKLLLVIAVATGAGFFVRARWFSTLSKSAETAVDGLSAVFMALVVLGLMSAMGEALRVEPVSLLIMLLFACVLNFGFQVAGYLLYQCRRNKAPIAQSDEVTVGVISGNRNIALFLTALPTSVIEPLLLFIGCYQVPMYLTPLVMKRFYRSSVKSNQ